MATTKKKILFNEHNDNNDDQISISSSSVSTESFDSYDQSTNLPIELRQRQNRQKLYHIVNEVCTSEAKFVDTLRLLNINFRNFIQQQNSAANWPSQINECINNLLKYLPHLQELNENLLQELESARESWPKTQKISHILVKIGPFLKHYSSYIKEFEHNQTQLNECMRKYVQFADKVHEFENNEPGANKLCIQHHLLRPIQRIPQYRLLLQQYLHHLLPQDADYEDTVNALEVVSRVAEHANQSMNEGLNFSRLLALQSRLVGKKYPNVATTAQLIRPGRIFVREGELMKVSRKQVQTRWFVLLNDALLYTTRLQSSDLLYLNQELPLDDECLVWTPEERKRSSQLVGQEFENEFSVCTRLRSFTLVAKCKQERDNWVRDLRQSVEDCIMKRRSFCSVGTTAAASIYKNDNNNTNDGCNKAAEDNGQQQQQRQLEQAEHLDGETDVIDMSNGHRSSNSSSTCINAGSAAPNEQTNNNSQVGQTQTGNTMRSLLGQKAPLWTPDSRVSMCQLCASSFSALFRRHHCRACGRVLCSACSSNRAPLIYLKCRAARVCDQCFSELKSNIHLYYLHASSRQQQQQQQQQQSGSSTNDDKNSDEIERELRRLDEHFRTLLKSQFEKHVTMGPLKRALVSAASRIAVVDGGTSSGVASVSGSTADCKNAGANNNDTHGRQRTTTKVPRPLPVGLEGVSSAPVAATTGASAANDSGSIISGYLHKRHIHKSKWKRHWYVMKDSALFTYRAIDDVVPISCMSLRGYSVEQPELPIDALEPAILVRLYHITPMVINESDENNHNHHRAKSDQSSSLSGSGATATGTNGLNSSSKLFAGCKEISVLKTCIENGLTQLTQSTSAPSRNAKQTPNKSLVMEHLFRAESVGAAERWLEAFQKLLWKPEVNK